MADRECVDCGAGLPLAHKYRCPPCVLAAYRKTLAEELAALQEPVDETTGPEFRAMDSGIRAARIRNCAWMREQIAALEAKARKEDGASVA